MARAAAVALAVVIALSALVAVPHLPEARASSIHPSALGITALDSSGSPGPFRVGLGSGTIYFDAYGGVFNTTANVTITDQNATRDHVPSPAAHWQIVFGIGGSNDSLGSSNYYQIPLGLNFSGAWNITLNGSGSQVTSTFLVEAYSLYLTPDRGGYLPGHTGTIFWLTYRDANDGPFQQYTSLQVIGVYRNTTGVIGPLTLPSHTLNVAANGTFAFTVPSDAAVGSSILIEMWANQSGPGTNWSVFSQYTIQVNQVDTVDLSFLNCFGSCGTFRTGTPVEVGIDVVLSGSGIGDGLTAAVSFFSGTQLVAAPSGTPTALTTNNTGQAALVFIPMSGPFSTAHNNSVSVTITDSREPLLKVTSFIDFDLTNVSTTARLQVLLDQATYYSGDTVTAAWSLGGANSSAPMGWSIAEVYAEGDSGGHYTIFAYGSQSSTATSGKFVFQIPAGFQGQLYVEASAYNATTEIGGEAGAVVEPPTLIVNPSETIYRAGDQLSVTVVTEGQAFSSATIYETTTDSSGDILASGIVSGATFGVTVPSVAPPTSIRFVVIAQNSGGGVIATASAEIALQSGYRLTASVQTSSSYSDGSYQPGQTLTVSYSFSSLGTTPLPSEITVEIVPGATLLDLDIGDLNQYPGTAIRTTLSDSGTMTFTLPNDLPNGYTSVLVFAYPTNAAGAGCSDPYSQCGAASELTVNVQGSPSALNFVLGSGSGLTLGWLILLVLILIVAIVGTLWIRRRMGGGGSSKWSSPPKSFTSTPPAGDSSGGTTGGPSAPSDAGSSGSPPLPPPSGSS